MQVSFAKVRLQEEISSHLHEHELGRCELTCSAVLRYLSLFALPLGALMERGRIGNRSAAPG